MFCNKCGNNLGDAEGIRFCTKCGNDLSVSAVKVEKVVEEPKVINAVVEEPQPQVINTVVEEPKVDLEKRKSNKKKLWIIAIVCCVLWVGLIIGIIVLLAGTSDNAIDYLDKNYEYEYDNEEEEDADLTWGNDEEVEDEEEDTPIVTEGNRIGTDEQGYVTVPESWEEKDTGYDGMIQYLNASEGSITLYSVNSSLLSAKAYADNVEDTMPSQGIDEVKRENVKLAGYDAYKLWGYSDTLRIWLTVWIFEAEDDQTHYLAIETLAEDSEQLDIADTFSLDK